MDCKLMRFLLSLLVLAHAPDLSAQILAPILTNLSVSAGGGGATIANIGTVTGNFSGAYVVTITASAAIGTCIAVALINNNGTAGAMTVADTGLNTYPATTNVSANSIGSYLTVARVTTGLTSGVSTITATPANDGGTVMNVYKLSSCPSTPIDQTATGNNGGTDAFATASLTPSLQPEFGLSLFGTVAAGQSPLPSCTNIIGSAATQLDLSTNSGGSRYMLTCWRNLTATTAGTATATSNGGWQWTAIFQTVKQ